MPDNVATMVDFNHAIVELVGNEVMVGCRGGDSRSQHNCEQSGETNRLAGKFHGHPPVKGGPLRREPHRLRIARNLGSGPWLVVRELSENCHFLVKFLSLAKLITRFRRRRKESAVVRDGRQSDNGTRGRSPLAAIRYARFTWQVHSP